MSTSFTISECRRALSVDMFADLGVPIISFVPIPNPIGFGPYLHGYQISTAANLTPDDIVRAKMRLQTWTPEDEAVLVSAYGAVVAIDAYRAIPVKSPGVAIAMVDTLAADVKAIILWIAKDAIQ